VTLRAPVGALLAMEILAVSCVALTNDVDTTVMPAPENVAVAPLTKPVPVIVMFWFVAPWPREAGFVDVTLGFALIVKPTEAEPPSGFVTVIVLAPVVAFPAIVTFAVTCALSTKVVELTVTPVPENDAVAPAAKFVPVIVMSWAVAP
jgi:hypothetical protein